MLSICIPTFNRDQLLARHLGAIAEFTSLDVQVTVSDNCSTPATRNVIESFRGRLPDLKYVRHPEQIPINLNWDFAIRMATQPYVFALADDDISLEEGLSNAVRRFRDDPSLTAAYGGYEEVDLAGNRLAMHTKCTSDQVYADSQRLEIARKHWSLEVPMFRRDFYERTVVAKANTAPNSWVFLKQALRHGRVVMTPEVFFKHTIHKGRLTETSAMDGSFNFIYMSEMEAFLSDLQAPEAEKIAAVNEYTARLYDFHTNVCLRNNEPLGARFFIAKGMVYAFQHFLKRAQQWEEQHLFAAAAQAIAERVTRNPAVDRIASVDARIPDHLLQHLETVCGKPATRASVADVREGDFILTLDDDAPALPWLDGTNSMSLQRTMDALGLTGRRIVLGA